MKPVELEIFLQDEISPGLKKAGQTVQGFSDDSKKRLRELSESVKIQRDVVKQLENQYKELGKSLKNAAPGQQWFDVKAQMGNVKAELDAEKAALQDLTEQQRKLKIEAENAGTSLRQQLRNVREEIATLLLAYRSLSEQEKQTAQGQQLARYIDELTEKAGELNDAIGDTAQAVRNAASDTRSFDQLAGGVQLVVDGFGLATAGAEALGLSEASLAEVQTRLQTALVASNALSSMQVNLQKQSALMQGINVIQTKAAATAENIRTWAVGRGVIATKAATIAQAAFNKIAKANPYVLLAMGVTTVVGALYAFAKGSDAAKKADEERRKQIEESNEINKEFANKVASEAAGQISSFIKLKKTWEDLGDSFNKKKKFIAETKDEWKKLGKEISSVNDAEKIFKNYTGDIIDAIVKRALAKGYEDIVTEQAGELANKLVSLTQTDTPIIKAGDVFRPMDKNKKDYRPSPLKGEFMSGLINSKVWNEDLFTVTTSGQPGWQEGLFTQRGADLANAYITLRKKHDFLDLRNLSETEMLKKAYEERTKDIIEMAETANKEAQDILNGLPGITVNPDKPEPPTKPEVDRVSAARKEAEELRKFRWQNEQDEINQLADGAERRRRQIALDYEKEVAEIEARRRSFAELNAAAEVQDVDAAGLTEAQAAEIARAEKVAQERRAAGERAVLEERLAAMRDYLKEYGSLEQRRLAIAEEYDDKIRKAETDGDRLKLKKEKEHALSALTFENISMGIDWQALLSGVGSMSHEMLHPMLEQLEAYTKTDEYAKADMQEREKVTELIQELREYIGTEKDTGWETLAKAITDFTAGVAKYKDLEKREREAISARELAKGQLERGEITQEDFDKISVAADELGRETAAAGEEMRGLGMTLNETSDAVKNYVSPLTAALNNLGTWDGVEGFGGVKGGVAGIDALKGALDGALPGMGDGIGKELGKGLSSAIGSGLTAIGGDVTSLLSSGVGSVVGIIAQIPKLILDLVGSVKGMVTGVLDSMTELISLRWIDDLVNGILDSVGGLIDAIFDLPENLYHVVESIVVDGVGSLLNTVLGRLGNILTLGVLGSGGPADWFTNSNGKEVQDTINRLTERNELLQTAIEDLTDEIKASKGTKSVAAYKEAYNLQKETNANYLDMAMAQAGYHGSHHSWSYYWGGFTEEEIAKVSNRIGRTWNGDIWNLSPEEMKGLRSFVDLWEKILNTGKGGYGDRLGEKLDDYIDQAGKLEELTNQLYEGLTGISFDSMYDSFIDQLMDMEASAEDFADNVNEYFMRAMLSNAIGERYYDQLKEWWEKFGKAMEDGELTDAERNALSEEYMKYVEDAMKLRDDLAAATGYGDSSSSGRSQSGKAGAFTAMSQDQGTKLEGLMTSVQGHVAHIDGWLTEDVSARMSAAEGYLARIAENTKENAERAEEIKELIIQLIRDGLKMR